MSNVEVLRMRTETLGEHLRKLAMRADTGELRSGSMSFTTSKNEISTSWWMQPGAGDSLLIVAGIAILNMEVLALIKEEME